MGAVALGGMAGGLARYLVGVLLPPGTGIPWATLLVNLSGTFLLGVVTGTAVRRRPGNPLLRPFLATGVLGAYTTFSTFAVETVLLADRGDLPLAALYVVCSVTGGLAAAWCGLNLAGGPEGQRAR